MTDKNALLALADRMDVELAYAGSRMCDIVPLANSIQELRTLAQAPAEEGDSRPPADSEAVALRNMPEGTTFEEYRDQLAVGNLTPVDQMAFDNMLHDRLAASPSSPRRVGVGLDDELCITHNGETKC